VGVEVVVGAGVWLGTAVVPGCSGLGIRQLKIERANNNVSNPIFTVALVISAIIFDLIFKVNLATCSPPC
jgi:hypothetical protein